MSNLWIEDFKSNPSIAFRNLMSGKVPLAASYRLDVPEILHSLFSEGGVMGAQRDDLDRAIYDWLSDSSQNYYKSAGGGKFSTYSKRLVDALSTIHLLNLRYSINRINASREYWLSHFGPLRIGSDRDPALECWRLLTTAQADRSLISSWLRLATRPQQEYLLVALRGLERFKSKDAEVNRTLMLRALLIHAIASEKTIEHACANFKRRYAALRGRAATAFPRAPKTWQNELDSAFSIVEQRDSSIRAREIISHLRGDGQKKDVSLFKNKRKAPQPGSIHEIEDFLKNLEKSEITNASKIKTLFTLIEARLDYAQKTGDSFFFIRTLCRLGQEVMKRNLLQGDDLFKLRRLIEQAFSWEPYNTYCWALFAETFRGDLQAQEWVFRETARTNPNEFVSRVEIARILIKRGPDHWNEAELWLREAAERNPQHLHSRVELARLLRARGEQYWADAERILRDVVAISGTDQHSRVELARLLLALSPSNRQEARGLLEEAVASDPSNLIVRVELAHLLISSGEENWAKAKEYLGRVVDSATNDLSAPEMLRLATSRLALDRKIPESTLNPDRAFEGNDLNENENRVVSFIEADIAQKGQLSADFYAIIASGKSDTSSTYIDDAAEKCDPLAGFYREWLVGRKSTEPPPNAWAWQACRLWKEGASDEQWRLLRREVPEFALETDFLVNIRTPMKEDDNHLARLVERLSQEERDDVGPRRIWMSNILKSTGNGSLRHHRDDIARVVMESSIAPTVALSP